ncbi:MAG: zinc metallopeptidase [Clostridiales bacterium]|nr:zinc metallopeptidase [Clostridiales bacterium]
MFGSYLYILILAVGLGVLTQWYVSSSFKRYAKVPLATGRSGYEVARAMLDAEGLHGVGIERVSGHLSDHYDPRARVLRLSKDVHDGRSVAAAGVAAHEAGHAVQHARSFAPAAVRQLLVPAANIGSQAALPLILLGAFMAIPGLMSLGVLLFAGAVLFQLVTLPVEFDASRRALSSLTAGNVLPADQVRGARKVLTAAALTYVAATLIAVLQLLYFLGLARR